MPFEDERVYSRRFRSLIDAEKRQKREDHSEASVKTTSLYDP